MTQIIEFITSKLPGLTEYSSDNLWRLKTGNFIPKDAWMKLKNKSRCFNINGEWIYDYTCVSILIEMRYRVTIDKILCPIAMSSKELKNYIFDKAWPQYVGALKELALVREEQTSIARYLNGMKSTSNNVFQSRVQIPDSAKPIGCVNMFSDGKYLYWTRLERVGYDSNSESYIHKIFYYEKLILNKDTSEVVIKSKQLHHRTLALYETPKTLLQRQAPAI